MGDHGSTILYFFAALGIFETLCFILIQAMDKGMPVLRRAREHFLEIKSWKHRGEAGVLPKAGAKLEDTGVGGQPVESVGLSSRPS